MTRFMTLDFAEGGRDAIRRRIDDLAAGPYAYVVTPNVDHVVKLLDGRVDAAVYRGATLTLCDSRILAHLARLRGRRIDVYPGSDLTADLLARADAGGPVIAVFGPDADAFADLRTRFPRARLVHLSSGVLTPGTAAWDAAVARVAAADWDVLLSCISFPKQERFAHALGAAGRERGVALCVGASVDFLTGRQKRAPAWVQRLSLEWLHRLVGQPRRMARRYLIEAPAIFGWFLRTEVLGRQATIRSA